MNLPSPSTFDLYRPHRDAPWWPRCLCLTSRGRPVIMVAGFLPVPIPKGFAALALRGCLGTWFSEAHSGHLATLPGGITEIRTKAIGFGHSFETYNTIDLALLGAWNSK